MRLFFIFILVLLFENQSQSQLYYGNKGWLNYYVDITKDSAHVEIFRQSPPDFTNKFCDEKLSSNTKIGDTCFKGKQTQIIKRKSTHYILFKPYYRKNVYKIRLELCKNDNRKSLRIRAYASKKRVDIMKLQDSLSGPVQSINLNVNNTIRRVGLGMSGLADSIYIKMINKTSDSLINQIFEKANPIVYYYYYKSDSLDQLDTAEINKLLTNANYTFPYGKFFLYKLALAKPESLIHFIDKDPANKDSLLRAIRNHNNYREITKKVKDTPIKSTGKKEIVRQKSNRVITDIAVETAIVTIFLSELALLTGAIIWIF